MNSIVTVDTQDLDSSKSVDVSVVSERLWSTDQDGPNDKMVDIWFNNKWVPAYFKDIRKGDFFLMIGLDLEPGKCFVAMSSARALGKWSGNQTYIINDGMEIAQAPALKDIPAETLPHQVLPLLEKDQQ